MDTFMFVPSVLNIVCGEVMGNDFGTFVVKRMGRP